MSEFFTYVVISSIVGSILGTLVLAVMLILGFGWAAVGWGLLVWVVFLIIGVVLGFINPFKF